MIKKLKLAEYKNGFQKYLLIAILAFFVANSTVLGFPSPFGVIVTAFLPVNLSSIFIITLFVVRIFLGVDALSLATLFSALIVYLINLIQSRLSVKKKSFTVILQPFLIYLICSILFLISFSSSLEEYLIALIFSALTFILSLSLSKSNEKKISPYIFIAFITLFSSIDFTYINIGRVFGIYSVFAISYSFGALCACFVGALVLIGVSLYDPSLFETTAFISILTLACANKGVTKRLQIPIYSVSTAIVCAVISGYDTNSIGFVIDTLLAASIYLFTDKKAFMFLSKYVSYLNNNAFTSKLAVSIIDSERYSISSLSQFLKNIFSASSKISTVAPFDSAYSDICMKCKNHNLCYKSDSIDPKDAFYSCIKKKDVEKHIDMIKNRNDYISKLSASRQEKLREFLSTFDVMSNSLSDISVNINKLNKLNFEMTKKLETILLDNRINTLACYVFTDNSIFVDVENGRRTSETKLCLIVSELMHYDYSLPEVIEIENSLRFCFYTKPNYSTDCGVYMQSANGTECGDSFECFTFLNTQYCILSDGMGTGKSASISSKLLISLIKRQIICGVGVDAAVSFASLAMRSISTDESFATLDLITADLRTGELKFIKAGSCKSYVIGEGICDVSCGGYPIGILNEINTKVINLDITSEITVIVMMTDGAKEIPYQLIEKAVRENINLSSEEIAQIIFERAEKTINMAQRDDLTIIIIKIEKK